MTGSTFYKYFAFTSLGTTAILIGLCQFSIFQDYLLFSFLCLALFMLLTWAMFLIGEKTAKSPNKGLFTGIVLGFTFGKIILSLFVVVGYHQLANPPSKVFLLPFFIVYLIFTIFETYIMMQIGQHSKPAV